MVVVVNASSFFSGQSDTNTPTTLSLTIPASQVASLSHASLHAGAGAQAVTFFLQQTDTAPQQLLKLWHSFLSPLTTATVLWLA